MAESLLDKRRVDSDNSVGVDLSETMDETGESVPFWRTPLHRNRTTKAERYKRLFILPGFVVGSILGQALWANLVSLPASAAEAELPSQFDLRNVDGRSFVTRGQEQLGSDCRAYASFGSLESNILMQGLEGTTLHTVWDVDYDIQENPFLFQRQVLLDLAERHVWDTIGSEQHQIITYLAAQKGPVYEEDHPVHWIVPNGPKTRRYAFERATFLPSVNDAKRAIMTHGALFAQMTWNNDYAPGVLLGYNSGENTYFGDLNQHNHGVTVIGWDDEKTVSWAPGKGAWLIRNTARAAWGSMEFEEGRYFWLSYFDHEVINGWFSTDQGVISFQMAPLDTYTHAYFLGTGNVAPNRTNYSYVVNAFTADQADPLKSVGFWVGASNITYTIQVHSGVTAGGAPIGAPLALKSGTLEFAGFHVVNLDAPLPLAQGTGFSILLRLTGTGSGNYAIGGDMINSPTKSWFSSNGTNWSSETSHIAALYAYTGVTPSPPPLAPTSGRITGVTANTATAEWTAASDATIETTYTLAAALNTTLPPVSPISKTGIAGSTDTVTGLTPNTVYYLSVNATNNAGSSAYTALGSTVTLSAVPAGFQASGITATQTILSWTANGNPNNTTFLLQQSSDNGSTYTTVYTGTNLTSTRTDLLPGTTYLFRVLSRNIAGFPSAPTGTVSVTPPPPAPASGQITGVTANTATAQWSSAPGATTYTLAAALNTTLPPVSPISKTGIAGSTDTVTGLTANKRYYLSVSACNSVACSAYTALGSTVTPTASPTGLQPISRTLTTITLSWTSAGNTAGTVYVLQQSNDGGSTYFDAANTTATQATVTQLNPEETYHFRVKAEPIAGGTPSYSSEIASATGSVATDVSRMRAYPNPTTGPTVIDQLPDGATVTLYTTSGEQVQSLPPPTDGRTTWDGKNESGEPVASGIYQAVASGAGTKTVKIAVQR